MKRAIATFTAIILAAALAGCASPSYYQAADKSTRHYGYSDRQVDGPLFRVIYIAYATANLDQTYAFAIFRAAELASSKGATHFEVLEGPINKDAIERFIGKATASNVRSFDGTDLNGINSHPMVPPTAIYAQSTRYYTQGYIYVPIEPPPPPVQISLLIRLLSAPSLDPVKGFDVNDLLTKLSPKIVRPSIKTT